MGNLILSLKRFLGNKNTVTILGVVAGVVVLYVGYNWRVNQAIEPQKVPFAKQELAANTLVTTEHVGTIKVSKNMVDQTPNLVTSSTQVVGKYIKYDTFVPQGSLFYSQYLIAESELPNYITVKLEEGHQLFSLPVNMTTTYSNSILPGNYIDLYVQGSTDDGRVFVSKLIESIKVRDVRDENGISTANTQGNPAELIFSVPDKMFSLLTRTQMLDNFEIFPVLRGYEYSKDPKDTTIASEELEEIIDSKSNLNFDK